MRIEAAAEREDGGGDGGGAGNAILRLACHDAVSEIWRLRELLLPLVRLGFCEAVVLH